MPACASATPVANSQKMVGAMPRMVPSATARMTNRGTRAIAAPPYNVTRVTVTARMMLWRFSSRPTANPLRERRPDR